MSEFSDDEPPVNVSPILAPDENAALEHLGLLFGRAHEGKIEITALHVERGVRTQFFDVGELEDAASHAMSTNRQPGWNVYVGAALRKPGTFPGSAADDSDFLKTYAVWADADDGEQVQGARDAYRAADLTPPFVVITGTVPTRRAHLWWPLETPIDNIETLRAVTRGLAVGLGTDTHVCTGKQIMRLAGSLAWPKKEGRTLERVTIFKPVAVQEFSVEQIAKAFPPVTAAKSDPITDIKLAPTGSLGLGERITDGRETHAFRLIRANLREWIGTTGSAPTTQELFEQVAQPYFNRIDQSRPGRGPEFLKRKCVEAIKAFHAGMIPGARSLEEAVVTWKEKGPQAVEEDEPPDAESVFDPWQRYPVPSFPLDALPTKVANFVRMTAKSTGGDISAVAMSALVVCSAALSQEFRLKMKRTGTWYARPHLWSLLIGDSAAKKTPIMASCVAPLRRIETAGVDAYRKAHAQWKALGKEAPSEDEPPRPTRYLFNDITTEKLGEILSRQDRGALVEADEVAGWIGAMDKYNGGRGSAADRAFWLQAYNGGYKTIDRLGRGEIFISNLCVSFIGGIQPARLTELGNLTSDGLLQRFLPVMMGRSQFPEEVEDEFAQAGYENLITHLTNSRATTVTASEGALEAFDTFQRYAHDLEQMEALGDGFRSFIGKLAGVQGSLALTLQMMHGGDGYTEVGADAAHAATSILTEFIIPHGLEFYSVSQGKGDWSALRALASYVLTSDKDRFTAADLTRDVYALRGSSVFEMQQAVSPLIAGGWLAEDQKSVPTRAWFVVPGLREALSDRRESEVAARSRAVSHLRLIREKGHTPGG